MSDSPTDLVRHALKTAREYGFRRVRLRGEGVAFHAALMEDVDLPLPVADVVVDSSGPASQSEVCAAVVGYFREGATPLRVGQAVAKGEVLATIAALGLANDVEAPADGTVCEVLVAPDQPVEYGQVLARIDRGGA